MPDLSRVEPINFALQGGLVLNKSTFAMQPGEALELILAASHKDNFKII